MAYAVSVECFCTFHTRRQQNGFKWQRIRSVSRGSPTDVDNFQSSPVHIVHRPAVCGTNGIWVQNCEKRKNVDLLELYGIEICPAGLSDASDDREMV